MSNRSNRRIAGLIGLAVIASFGAALVRVPAASADGPSPAGTVGGVIIVSSPSPGGPPAVLPSIPPIIAPRGGLTVPVPATPKAPGFTIPNTFLTPTPATGSLLVPVSGPTFTQWQLIIPGPNSAQNTPVSLQQILNTLLAGPAAPSGTPVPPVGVYTVPPR